MNKYKNKNSGSCFDCGTKTNTYEINNNKIHYNYCWDCNDKYYPRNQWEKLPIGLINELT